MSSVNGVGVADRLEAVKELLRQRCLALGLVSAEASDSAVEAGIELLLEREVKLPVPTEEECRRFYAAHQADFMTGELVFARHILFAVTPAVPVDPLRTKAEQTLAELLQHPDRFAERARELSNCPSGQQDGNLGQLARGECVPEFDQVVFGSRITGLLPQLVKTRYGFHIVAVDRRAPGQRVPFEVVHASIAAHLAEVVGRKALTQYVAVLAGKADLQGVDLMAAASPLVQ